MWRALKWRFFLSKSRDEKMRYGELGVGGKIKRIGGGAEEAEVRSGPKDEGQDHPRVDRAPVHWLAAVR